MGKRTKTEKNAGPQFVRFFYPLIDALKDLGGSGRPSEVRDIIAQKLNIDESQRSEITDAGGIRYDNQVAWARFYLSKAGFLDSSTRGVWNLTENGRTVRPFSQDEAIKIFQQVRDKYGYDKNLPTSAPYSEIQPEETTAPISSTVIGDNNYRTKLMDLLKSLPPSGFERLCQRLLRESGFEQVVVTGRSGDGGIDGHGLLQINPLVSFKVLFQCKRYEGNVTPSQVRDFRGAMMGRADKGIIITTGNFTSAAQEEALRDRVPPIELVSGDKLLNMFENLELGLVPRKVFDIDFQFFEEFGS